MSVRPTASFVRFVVEALVLTGLMVLAGWLPTQNLVGQTGLAAMWVGCAISLVASIVGVIPAAMAFGNPKREALAVMGACMALRLALVTAGGLAAVLSGRLDRNPLLIWLALSYAILLIADTRFVLKAVKTRD